MQSDKDWLLEECKFDGKELKKDWEQIIKYEQQVEETIRERKELRNLLKDAIKSRSIVSAGSINETN